MSLRIAWMADAETNGPMVRARAVLERAPEGSLLLSRRVDLHGLPGVSMECCYPRDPQTVLACVDADVIIADYQHWRHAEADGRPFIRIGFAHREETMWDLDAGPLHPWCAPEWAAPNREELRRELDVDRNTALVVSMSPSWAPNLLESRLTFGNSSRVKHVAARNALDFFAADLIVISAGWSGVHEARWSGVPYCAIDFGQLDQHLRATHTMEEAQRAIWNAARVEPVLPERHDWAGELLSLL